ncbi:uncharacterized protein [Elaeis guineensis]|uniref:TBC1 domain family member 15 n=1 Tax=Elaeis guineensis var. tenera TaxID=51953 RepID=A0A6I9QMX4_ELAGV|nr:TBC1 domain family member 17 isoform X3 [Elaeis guineensis]
MHEAELHDLSDDSDYAASQQQASGSIMRCDSGKSAVTEPNGSEVVYSKDNVTIHPTQYASERISGRLLLVKQGSSLFMSWIPYKASTDELGYMSRSSNSGPTEKDRSLYTIKNLPLTDVRSIRRHTPALGWQYIIVVLSSGLAFPPLYFYSGGVREFLGTLKQHIFIMRSADDANVFLVNDFQDPLQFDKLPLVWGKQRESPLCLAEWAAFLDSEGRVVDSKALRKRIFYGGAEHNLRKEVWKFLLGYHEYDSTFAEREYLAAVKKSEYDIIKSQWQSISATQAKRFTKFRERKGLIEKDVVRTDRSISYYEGEDNPNVAVLRDILLTYSFYNFDLGYCQGMSDFLSPILYVMKDESESFWCFVALMERLGPNFNRDQNGMHSQLLALSKLVELLDSPLHNYLKQADCLNYFFCFRWILIQFKREFEYLKVMHLWEVLWTHYLSEHFHLYMCVAILKRYRKKIMGEQMDFDTLLKFINELSGHIDLDGTIRDAEALCACAGENGTACIPPGTPPSLPVETDMGLYPQDDDVL